ncbi:MAG TPA: alpha/beta hydrolase domain-containing protein [Candidatus Dormibacteraeota bacterium]
MPVLEAGVHRRAAYEDGRTFGAGGAYERVDGVVQFAVDPDAPENAGITDLRLAPRDGSGRVRFAADFCILRPADPARASGRLLFHVANRGRYGVLPFSVPTAPPAMAITERIDPGDAFLLRRGWTIAWCGWQWDVLRRPGLLGLLAPEAVRPEGDRDGQVLVQFQPHVRAARHGLDHWPLDPPPGLPDQGHRPNPPRDRDDPSAVLCVRDWPNGPAAELPRASWRLDDASVWLEGGFEPGRVYELRYRPRDCPVAGAGLLAVRDFVSWLRGKEDDLPHLTPRQMKGGSQEGGIERAFAFGVSQSGRFLRELLFHGLNLDEAGRIVFDGVLVHVAGARRGEFNQRFGQPSVQHSPSLGHLPPFADAHLLRRQRELGGVPRVLSVNTSSEYWRSEASLCHDGVELPEEARSYLFAGCQHSSGAPPPARTPPTTPWAQPANGLTTVDYLPLLRAALVNLDRWVSDGVEPPPSAVPDRAAGTAAERAEVLERFSAVPGVVLPRRDHLPTLRRLDLGERTADGIVRLPAAAGEPYRCFVSSVDGDLNEEAGIRLPDLTVPLASHTGWNPRRPESGGEGQLLDMLGSTIPLPRSREERERTGDPRRSIAERYAGRDDFLRQVRGAAERLVAERHLLAEDVELVMARAGLAYDTFTGGSADR